MLEEFRSKLQKEMGLEEPFGAAGQENFSLLFDDVKVNVSAAPPGFQISATLGSIPKNEPEIFLVKLLRGNLFFQATAGSILGLDDSGDKVTLQYHYPMQPAYSDFKAVFEDFLNDIDFWKKEMKEHLENPLAHFE